MTPNSRDIAPELLEIASELAERYVKAADVECVLIIGSLTAGLGNEYSDLDLYVVSGDSNASVPTLVHGKKTRVDVEQRRRGWLQSIVAEACTFTATTKDVAYLMRSTARLDTVGRLYYAVPLIDHGEYEAARSYLLEHFTDFRRFVMAREAAELHGTLEDCLGALSADDAYMAAQLSEQLLLGALQVFVVGCGSVYLGKKWLSARLREVASESTPVETLLTLCTSNAGLSEREAVFARIRYAQAAVAAALTLGWDEPGAGRWSYWPDLQGGGRERAPNWMALRLTDAIVLVQIRGRHLRIPEAALRLWGMYPHSEEGENAEKLVSKLSELGALN